MNASISVVCYRSKTLKNGEHPLMVRVFKDGKRKYQSLGISLSPEHWDFNKEKPTFDCPNGEFIQKIILDEVQRLQSRAIELRAIQGYFTLSNLLTDSSTLIKYRNVGEYYSDYISKLISRDKIGSSLIFKRSLNSIKEFSKGKTNFLFSDITVDWLCRYEKWMRDKGNKDTTMAIQFRTLRSIFNKAIRDKCTHIESYPFNEYKISSFDTTTIKRALKKEQIIDIIQLELTGEVDFARDIFVFSYLCGGINFVDIANLTEENILDERLTYKRQKTGVRVNLSLSPVAKTIIIKHQKQSCGYLFPILNKQTHKTAVQKQNRIHKKIARIDKDLKKVAELANIQTNLTTYVARHTCATVLKRSGVSIPIISELLGHSSLETTQIYLDSFGNEQIDLALTNLL